MAQAATGSRMKPKPSKPHVGLVFWKLVVQRGFVRHEVRALVDAHYVVRHWTRRYGGSWAYNVEPLYLWELEARYAAFTSDAARKATDLWHAGLSGNR